MVHFVVESAQGGNDTVELDAGNTSITEGSGTTTLVTGLSGGSDVVQSLRGTTTVQLIEGLNESNLVARDVNGDLVLSDGGSAEVTLGDYFSAGGSVSLQFADGTTWGSAQILQASITPSSDGSNDTLVGSNGSDSITAGDSDTLIVGVSGNNTLTGGAGDDTIQGGSGADTIEGGTGTTQILGGTGNETYLFALGDGSDTISENTTKIGADTLHFGSGINASNVKFSYGTNSNDLLISFGSATSSMITIADFFASNANGHQVSSFQFSDGTAWTAAQVVSAAEHITGTTGNDTLNGTGRSEYFDGNGGNDVERGNGGSDTFVFNAGYGHLEIDEDYSSDQQPVLELGSGLTESDLYVTTDSSNLILTDGIGVDQIIVDTMWGRGPYGAGVAAVQFTDGTTLSWAQLVRMELGNGTTGNETLYGALGNDLIDGKGGDDVEWGGGGIDTFIFNSGYGDLEIHRNGDWYAGEPPSVLELGAGITASDLHVTTDGTNLILTDGIDGDRITIDAMWETGSADGDMEVQLADGTTLTRDQLIQMEVAGGTTGNDTIYGTGGADLIDGKGGDDVAYGNYGNDTFVFNAGYGHLEIVENYYNYSQSVLKLGAGITVSDLHVTSDGKNLIMTDGVSGDQITVDDMWQDVDDGGFNGAGDGITVVQLADGTTLTAAQLIQMEVAGGTTGNDILYGTPAAELIDGNGGNDTEYADGGSDTFVFNAGYGHLEINEIYTSGQQPVLKLGAGITSVLKVTSSSDQNLVFTDGVNGDQITLDGMATDSEAGVAVVQFADGSTLTAAQLQAMAVEINGTTSNDTLQGTLGAELIDGKGGNDSVLGEGGSDTFVFNAGYGQLAINESYTNSEQPVLQMGAGITASALRVTSDGTRLFLTDGISGDEITLQDELQNANDGVQVVTFADGTSLTAAQLDQMEMTGTTGSDTLYGTSGADLIDGKGGSDSVVGAGDNDTFVFNSGYGHLEINEVYKSGQVPVLQLGAGITASALHATKSGNNLVLTDGVSGDQVTLDGMWTTATDGVASVQLSDGTTLTRAQMIALEMTGTTGADTITGTSGADVIDGRGGSDSVVGAGGNDTFVFNSGYGHLEINEAYKSGQVPVLQLGAGIAASALHATKSGNNLVLTDGVSGDQITLDGMWTTATDGVASVQLTDGTTLTRAQMIALEMTGTTGADTITGTSGADVIDGKGGNDSVVGSGGNDTFVFNSGYGHLEINEVYTGSQQPVLQFGAGITASSLHVTESANNLIVADGVAGDQITLDKMWSTSTDGVGEVTFANGTTLTRAQLIQMEMTGTTGADTITGTSGADVIDGKGGNDSVIGSGGNDTFVFNSGYGHLQINEVYTSGQTPILQLGAGITSSALKVAKSGNNLVLTDGVSGDQVTFNNMWTTATDGVAKVTLADGTSLTRSQLITMGTSATTTPVAQSKAMSTSVEPMSVNALIHAMASYGGNDPAAITTSPTLNPTTSDLLLHAAA